MMFYKDLGIPIESLIFDVGANNGDKSALFSKIASRVVSVEPDMVNYNLLTKRFFFNSKIQPLQVAAASKAGTAELFIDEDGSPANTLSTKWKDILTDPNRNRWSKELQFHKKYQVETLTLDNIIEKYGIPYYIKIDVEGFELEVLEGLTQPIPIISVEANLPEFRDETLRCLEIMNNLDPDTLFNCTNEDFKFFWSSHLSSIEINKWLRNTDHRYFELFAIRPQ